MPVIVGNGTIEGGSSNFTVKNSSATVVYQQGVSTSGYTNNSNVPAFIAGYTADPGWVLMGTDVWAKVNQYCTTTVYNRGSHYNTSTTRFTAPITGPYLFIWTAYSYTSNYFHPQFYVNGSPSTRRYDLPYRIRGYGWVANYPQDAQMEEVIFLTAGDYVEAYFYSGGTTYQYVYYGLFQGLFVG